MRHNAAIALSALLLAAAAPSSAGNGLQLDSVTAGVLIHDRGPTSDNNEHGTDPNLELQFQTPDGGFWQAIGAPRLHLGLTPNLNGDTSALYGGITYGQDLGQWLFGDLALGLALHNGPLHAEDPVACEQDSDCGFGSRVILRYALELGLRLDSDRAVTLYYAHMSHQELFDDENEGIDHVGLRYRMRY